MDISNKLSGSFPVLYKILKEYKELIIIIGATIVITYFFTTVSFMVWRNSYPGSVGGIWYIYDACHYINIVRWFYGTSEEQRVLIVFFPLYPLLIKLFSFVLIDHVLSALVISNIAYAVAALYLFKIVNLDFSRKTAIRAVMYFSVFPTAYFLHAAYTEALFLALVISCFYYARQNRWLIAGILGALVSATRLTGIIIILALLLEYFHQRQWKLKDIKINIIWITLVPLGFCSYLIINYTIFGHPFQFLILQNEVWHKNLSLPILGFFNAIGSLGWKEPSQIITSALAELVVTLFALGLIIWMIFKYRPLYVTYSWLTWLVVTSNSYWLSQPRYMLAIFPVFIIMAKWGKNKGVHYAILFLSILFYGTFAARYTQGLWTF
ncbi:MAG: glycosyltransferase family 39 protein [Spirochaetales bacterium]|nr:glycosyltransferase family 39 protein [Spirochaetales bacterium]